MSSRQHTIAKEADFKGIGLHTGNMCKAVFKPAPDNHGVTLVRTDLPGQPRVQALYSNVISVIRGTTVGQGEMRVHTIEHMLSAVYALGIDNLIIELNANEPPVADGSSRVFFDALKEAGLVAQDAERKILAADRAPRIQEWGNRNHLRASGRISNSRPFSCTSILLFNNRKLR